MAICVGVFSINESVCSTNATVRIYIHGHDLCVFARPKISSRSSWTAWCKKPVKCVSWQEIWPPNTQQMTKRKSSRLRTLIFLQPSIIQASSELHTQWWKYRQPRRLGVWTAWSKRSWVLTRSLISAKMCGPKGRLMASSKMSCLLVFSCSIRWDMQLWLLPTSYTIIHCCVFFVPMIFKLYPHLPIVQGSTKMQNHKWSQQPLRMKPRIFDKYFNWNHYIRWDFHWQYTCTYAWIHVSSGVYT